MKNNLRVSEMVRIIAIIALAAVIGFSFLSCGENGPNDPSLGLTSAALGPVLNLGGPVWLYEYIHDLKNPESGYKIEIFDGTVAMNSDFLSELGGGAAGNITNGIFSFTMGTPDTLNDVNNFVNYFHEGWDNAGYDNPNAKGYYISAFGLDGYSLYRDIDWNNEESGGSVIFIFVTEDVKIYGTGKIDISDNFLDREIHTKSFDLLLKKGWNELCQYEVLVEEGIYEVSYTLGNPNSFRWILEKDNSFED